jgi:hypothetical protein
MYEEKRIISVVDDDEDISILFRLAIDENIDVYDVISFSDRIFALEHFTEYVLMHYLSLI